MKTMRMLLWVVVGVCLVLTWLPYFGIFNDGMTEGAWLPQAVALTYACNIVLTLCVFALYPLYYKPFIKQLRAFPLEEVRHD